MEQPAGNATTPQSQKKVFKMVEYKLKKKICENMKILLCGVRLHLLITKRTERAFPHISSTGQV